MRKKIGKYIVAIHPEYIKMLHEVNGCRTSEEKDLIFHELTHTISDFLKGEGEGRALLLQRKNVTEGTLPPSPSPLSPTLPT